MRAVDTSSWIEFLLDTNLSARIEAHFPERSNWLVPTIVQLELCKWAKREAGLPLVRRLMAFTQTCVIADLTSAIARSAADLCIMHKLPTADAVIYATALTHGADLVTCDRHFEGLRSIIFIPKSGTS